MIYQDKQQAQLECDLNTRKIGGLWVPRRVTMAQRQWWQPKRVDSEAMHVRRTMYVR